MDKKITFGLIVGTRGFFNPKLAREGRKQLTVKLDSLGYDYVILPEKATSHGAIETLADAKKCADLFKNNRDQIDGVIGGGGEMGGIGDVTKKIGGLFD